jgi:hypothetical protein
MITRENFDKLINEMSDELGVEERAEDYTDFWDDVYEDHSDLPLEALEEAIRDCLEKVEEWRRPFLN